MKLRVVLIKPSKYGLNGLVERFRWGFMPNATLYHIASMTPKSIEGWETEVHTVDEYVYGDLHYLQLLKAEPGYTTLLAIVGVQSHQFQRALDLAAFARRHGTRHCVIGGPHPMTCDTSEFQGRGVSFALAEAEMIWHQILVDAVRGELRPVYGADQRWAQTLDPPVIEPPSRKDLKRYLGGMVGIYPARGCPFTCNFCSVIKIAGRRVRSQSIETTMESLRRAEAAGVRWVMFTSDNFNKYPEVTQLLEAMIDARLKVGFFCQCDTQIARQPELVELMGRAGCFQMFVGVESFNRETLRAARKFQNRPEHYEEIVRLCRENDIASHFSNIIGFPEDTESGVLSHLDVLQKMGPNVTSFYILTPVPGTEQYDDFMAQNWISEKNLDRYDGSCTTWSHPNLSDEKLKELLFRCYREFYSASRMYSNLRNANLKRYGLSTELSNYVGYGLFNRYCTYKRVHPMSGGVGRVARDHVRDYLPLRREFYGYEVVPLPESLSLSAADEALNKTVNPSVRLFDAQAERLSTPAPVLAPVLQVAPIPQVQVPQMTSAMAAYEAAGRSARKAFSSAEAALKHAAEALKHSRQGALERADQAVKHMLESARELAVSAVEQARVGAAETSAFAAQAGTFASEARERASEAVSKATGSVGEALHKAAESARHAAEQSRALAQDAAEAATHAAEEIAASFRGAQGSTISAH